MKRFVIVNLLAALAMAQAYPGHAALNPADSASAFLLECYSVYRAQADWSGYELERRSLTVFDPATLLSVIQADAFGFKPVNLAVEKDGRFRLEMMERRSATPSPAIGIFSSL